MFAFTSEDDSLALPFAGRDPLGTQVIWQRRARDLVPALTGASRHPAGFQILLTALAWWPVFASQYGRPQKDLRNFFLLVEQAFARACKMKKASWPLPGSRRLNDAQEPALWIGLDPRRDLLVNSPLSNGTWGIYISPAINAGLVEHLDRLHFDLAQEVQESTDVLRALFGQIAKCLASPQDKEVVAQRISPKVMRLAEIVESPPQRQRIREALVEPKAFPLTRKLADLSSEDRQEPLASLVARSRRELPEFRDTLSHVQNCERYISSMDMAFEWLARQPGKPLKKLASELPVNLTTLLQAQARFKVSGSYEGLAGERMRKLADASIVSKEDLVEFLVSHHGDISTSRRAAPLVSWGDSKRLESVLVFERQEDTIIDTRHVWRNTYYLDSLRDMEMLTNRARR